MVVIIPKKCLTLGLCLEYETYIRGVFCPNLCVCVFVSLSSGPLGQPVIFSNNIVLIININIHFQIKLKTSWAPKYFPKRFSDRNSCTLSNVHNNVKLHSHLQLFH